MVLVVYGSYSRAALSLGGLVMIPGTIQAADTGRRLDALGTKSFFSTLPPFILFRLLQPGTRQWYGHVSPDAARARHNAPLWLATIISCALWAAFSPQSLSACHECMTVLSLESTG